MEVDKRVSNWDEVKLFRAWILLAMAYFIFLLWELIQPSGKPLFFLFPLAVLTWCLCGVLFNFQDMKKQKKLTEFQK